MRKSLSYRLALMMLGAVLITGCAGAKETEVAATTEMEAVTIAMSDVLPQAGEAAEDVNINAGENMTTEEAASEIVKEEAVTETTDADKVENKTENETTTEVANVTTKDNTNVTGSKKNNKKATKGTITVATVGSPNTEILQQAAVLLEEKGYQLKVEVCEDYLTPNQMVMDGKADCNYYQHEAFMERYNIEHGTTLAEVAKIHYEPLVIYSEKLESLEQVEKGMKVAISNNPTAIARALWLLQDVELVTLMSDADMNTVKDDVAENPYNLEFVFVEESELVGKLQDTDLVICDKDFLMQEAMDDRNLFLAQEKEETMMVQNLSQVIAAVEAENVNAKILAEALLSEEMKQFVVTKYQGSICIMTGDEKEEIIDTDKDE